MDIIAGIRRLLEKGVSIEDALTAGEELQRQAEEIIREETERRILNTQAVRRCRARKAPGETGSEIAPVKKRGTHIAQDWRAGEAEIRYAAGKGLTAQEIRDTAEYFHEYWLNRTDAAGAKMSWLQTWRVWILHDKRTAALIKMRQGKSDETPEERAERILAEMKQERKQ